MGERVRKLTSIEPPQLKLHSFAKFVGASCGGASGIKMAQAELEPLPSEELRVCDVNPVKSQTPGCKWSEDLRLVSLNVSEVVK